MNRSLRITRRGCQGTTLIEAVTAILVLGVAIPPLVGLFTEVASHSADATYQTVGLGYAEALMEEIVSKEFEDPDGAQGSFGTEEAGRSGYDDIDDYDGFSNSPPQRLDGTSLDDYGGFTRSVVVENVLDTDPDPSSPEGDGSTALKRIRVTVSWTSGRGGEISLTTQRARL